MNFIHYGEPQYWELRYQDEMASALQGFQTFDWYITFENGTISAHASKFLLFYYVGMLQCTKYSRM